MTASEFNEKYKEYLEEGHYGLTIDNSQVVETLNEGFKDLILIPGFKYYQIKLKFDRTRVYTSLNGGINYILESYINKILEG